jgi:hypothetical protein
LRGCEKKPKNDEQIAIAARSTTNAALLTALSGPWLVCAGKLTGPECAAARQLSPAADISPQMLTPLCATSRPEQVQQKPLEASLMEGLKAVFALPIECSDQLLCLFDLGKIRCRKKIFERGSKHRMCLCVALRCMTESRERQGRTQLKCSRTLAVRNLDGAMEREFGCGEIGQSGMEQNLATDAIKISLDPTLASAFAEGNGVIDHRDSGLDYPCSGDVTTL